MKIKDLPKIERPREKLEKYGPERLFNPVELWSAQKTEKPFSWLTSVKDIIGNDYILSANTYNPYSSEEEVNHREPKEILEEIETEDEKIKLALDEIKRIL